MTQHGTIQTLLREAEGLLRQNQMDDALARCQEAADQAAEAGQMELAVEALLTMARALHVVGAEEATRDLALYALGFARAKGIPQMAEQAQTLLLTLYAGALALQPLLAGVRGGHPATGFYCGPYPPIFRDDAAPTLEAR